MSNTNEKEKTLAADINTKTESDASEGVKPAPAAPERTLLGVDPDEQHGHRHTQIPAEAGPERLYGILRAAGNGKNYDIPKIKKAYEYAARMHEGQFRDSGEPYVSHPLAVAEIVAGLGLDTDSVCAALLHDTVEDCSDKTSLEDISKQFGPTVAMLVDGLTKIVALSVEDKEEEHIENLRKMLLAMSKDIRVIFIKLCDRLHNMRTLGAKSEKKQRTIALETMQVYAPLAHRLGMQRVKQELENLGLFYLDPIGYAEVKDDIEKKYGQNQNFIENIRATVDAKLREYNIDFVLEGRIKTVYSIYRKMYTQNKSFDEIYDFYALRIIVGTELECYTVLGIIHEMFKSMPGRFKDYISTPKPNMYRSLHTTVIGRDGIPFEVQIRTREMHEIAEYGVAAHWKYKSGEKSKADIDHKLEWIARLIETEDGTRDPDEFMQALKTDVFHEETYVFTPKGDVIALPYGSTVIDFAYAIHSAVGNKMIGAKVDGRIVPLDYQVKTGEIVEVLTSSQPGKGPSRDWLNIVKTSQARAKIRQWYKKERRDENIAEGKAEVEKEFKRNFIRLAEPEYTEFINKIAERQHCKSIEDFYAAIGYGGISLMHMMPKIKEDYVKMTKAEEPVINIAPVKKRTKSTEGVVVEGIDNCLIKFSRCCNPLPGDNIIGFITRGHGVSIHTRNCPNVPADISKAGEPDRWVVAYWDTNIREDFKCTLQISCLNRIGLFADVSSLLANMHIMINDISTRNTKDGRTSIMLTVSVNGVEHLNSLTAKLSKISGVLSVERTGV